MRLSQIGIPIWVVVGSIRGQRDLETEMECNVDRRSLLKAGIAVGLFAGAGVEHTYAQTARKLLTLIVPTAPGSATDVFARLLQPKLQTITGGTVVVENKPGATGSIGAEYVAKSDKDGSKLLFSELAASSAHPGIIANLRFDPIKDLQIVAVTHFASFILAVNPSSSFKTVSDLVAYGKANPGKLSIANSGVGTGNHIATIQLAKAWGVDVTHVPYPGGARAVQAVLTGETVACLNSIPLPGFVERGQLRGLAVSGVRRMPKLPDIPLFSELPTLGASDSGNWRQDPGTTMGATGIILAASGTPPAVLQKLSDDLYSILATPEMVATINSMGGEPRQKITLNDAYRMFERNIQTYTATLRDAGVTPQ